MEKSENNKEKLEINVKYEREQMLTILCYIAFSSSFAHDSRLPHNLHEQEVLNGFTGRSFRHLLNNLCRLKNCTYLEVGTFCGSSLISALHSNHSLMKKAYAIDNWSEFREHCDPAERFKENRELHIPEYTDKLSIIEGDCFSIDLSKIEDKIDIYFYDGAHTYEDHKKAFTYFNEVFKDTFIAIVDDWEKKKVRQATYDAFKDLDYKVLAKWEVMPPSGREEPMLHPDMNWWHGVSLFVIRK
jgi:hypothetical protein